MVDESSCCGDPLGKQMTVPAVPTTPKYQLFVTGGPIDRFLDFPPSTQSRQDGEDEDTTWPAIVRAGISRVSWWLAGGVSLSAAAQRSSYAGPEVGLVATGASTGDAFLVRVSGQPKYSGRLMASDGLVLEATKVTIPMPRATPTSDVSQLQAFCAEFQKDQPPPGTVYRVADAPQQERLKPMRQFFRAADDLATAGKLHPDSNPLGYLNFVKQYSLWTRLEGWNQQAFAENFLKRTKSNALSMGQAWTHDAEAAVQKAAAGRWADIQAVMEAAKARGISTGAP